MAQYNFTCPKCSHEIELTKKVSEVGIPCPHCGKRVIVPKHLRTKSKTGMIVMILLMILLGGVSAGIFLKMKSDDAKRKTAIRMRAAKEKADEERAVREAEEKKISAWKKVLDLISESNLKTEHEFANAAKALEVFKNNYNSPDNKALVETQTKKLADWRKKVVERTLADLKEKAAELAENGNYSKTVEIMRNYSGDFAKETKAGRLALENQYKLEIEKVKKLAREKREKAAMMQKREVLYRDVSKLLVRGYAKRAMAVLDLSPLKEDLGELRSTILGMSEAPAKAKEVFAKLSKVKVSMELKNGKHVKLTVLGLEKGKLKVSYKGKKKSIPIASISTDWLIKKISASDAPSVNLFLAAQMVSGGYYDDAEKIYAKAGTLSKYLLEALPKVKEENESLKKSLAEKVDEKQKVKRETVEKVVTPDANKILKQTLPFDFDEKLSKISTDSYALSIERLMLYYGVKVDLQYITLLDNLQNVKLQGFGAVDARMVRFIQFSKHEGRRANLKIRKIFNMDDSKFRGLVRRYNDCAKREGVEPIDLRGQHTHWFIAGIRKEFLMMNPETRVKAREKGCKIKFEKMVKAWIGRKTPVCWTVAFGDTEHPQAGMHLIIGYDDEKREITYLDEDLSQAKHMPYTKAWASTTGLYLIKPRVNK